jgi:hypothetical protein
MRRSWLVTGISLAIVVIGVAVFLLLRPSGPIPNSIKSQLTSTLFLPQPSKEVDPSTVKYDSSGQLLTYRINYAGKTMIATEQPTPDEFVDVPDVYTKLVTGLSQYDQFDCAQGTVYLTKPASFGGSDEVAVMNSKGTLSFMHVEGELSTNQWKQFFNNFEVVTN